MNNNAKIWTTVVVVILIIGGIWWYYAATGGSGSYENASSTSSTSKSPAAQGSVVFSVTDAAANMGNVTAVAMTVDRVDVHSDTQGWVTVAHDTKTFNLLELKAKNEWQLLAKVDVPADTYNQVRFHVAKVMVTESGKTKEAKLPSGELKLNSMLRVAANSTSTANLDMVADKSLHVTGNGMIIFAPVVKFESRSNANADVKSDNSVQVSGGVLDTNENAGMDVTGDVKVDFMIDSNAKLQVDTNGIIKIQGSSSASSSSSGARGGANSEVNLQLGY